jgi:hypothetical protein
MVILTRVDNWKRARLSSELFLLLPRFPEDSRTVEVRLQSTVSMEIT